MLSNGDLILDDNLIKNYFPEIFSLKDEDYKEEKIVQDKNFLEKKFKIITSNNRKFSKELIKDFSIEDGIIQISYKDFEKFCIKNKI